MSKSDEEYLVKETRSRNTERKNSEEGMPSKRWRQEENRTYAAYLKENEDEFQNK